MPYGAADSHAAALLIAASEPDAADRPVERLHRALVGLYPLERELLALHLAADVPFPTLANLHGCDVKTVRKRFQAAAQRKRCESFPPRRLFERVQLFGSIVAGRPRTASKCRSNVMSSAPVSRACAAIQISFVGIGVPALRSAPAMRPKRSAVVRVT